MNTGRLQFVQMPKPRPLPEVETAAQYAWLEGWWQGICVGVICGAALAVIVIKS